MCLVLEASRSLCETSRAYTTCANNNTQHCAPAAVCQIRFVKNWISRFCWCLSVGSPLKTIYWRAVTQAGGDPGQVKLLERIASHSEMNSSRWVPDLFPWPTTTTTALRTGPWLIEFEKSILDMGRMRPHVSTRLQSCVLLWVICSYHPHRHHQLL